MGNAEIQVTIGTVMTVSAVGGPAAVVAVGAGDAVLLAGYGIYKRLSSSDDQGGQNSAGKPQAFVKPSEVGNSDLVQNEAYWNKLQGEKNAQAFVKPSEFENSDLVQNEAYWNKLQGGN